MYLNCPRKIKEPQGDEDQVEKSWSPYYCMRYRCPFEPWNVKNQTLLSLLNVFVLVSHATSTTTHILCYALCKKHGYFF